MKKILAIAAAALCAAFADAADAAKSIDPVKAAEPAKHKYVDPNKYADYGPAMASEKGFKMAVEWQAENARAIEEATSCKELAKLAESEESMAALLAEVKGAYDTCPVVATQIAAISQKAMCAKCPKAPKMRARWTAALLAAAKDSKDDYRTMFFLDQLRWCGHADEASLVRELASGSSKAVKDFAEQVAKELEAAK